MDNIRRAIATFSIVAILSSFVVSTAFAGTFTDVKEGAYYYDAVEALVESGTIPGTVETYNPGGGLTRALAAKYVVEGAGWEVTTHDTATFKDVPKTHSEFDLIETAVDHEFMKGSGAKPGYFLPTDTVNRAEYAKMAVLSFELETYEPETPTFTDVKSGDWFYDYVETAAYYGVVKGKTLTTFAPAEAINRADGAVMTVRAQTAEAPAEGEGEGEGEGEEVEGDLEVSLSGDSPAELQTLPKGATGVVLGVWDFVAGEADVTVDSIKFARAGVGDTNDWSSVYVYNGATRVKSGKSISSDDNTVEFTGLNIAVEAEETVAITLKGDVASANITGNEEHYFAIASADDISIDGGEVSGDFPVSAETVRMSTTSVSTVTIVNGPSLSKPTVGQTEAKVASFKITAGANNITFDGITLVQNGTISNTYLENFIVKESVTSEELGTATALTGDKLVVTFDDPYEIIKSQNRTFDVYSDLTGGKSTDTFRLYLEEGGDLMVTDAQFGFGPVVTNTFASSSAYCLGAASNTCGASGSFQAGAVTLADNGPTAGNVPVNKTQVAFFDFTMTSTRNITAKDYDLIIEQTVTSGGTDLAGVLEADSGQAVTKGTAVTFTTPISDATTPNIAAGDIIKTASGVYLLVDTMIGATISVVTPKNSGTIVNGEAFTLVWDDNISSGKIKNLKLVDRDTGSVLYSTATPTGYTLASDDFDVDQGESRKLSLRVDVDSTATATNAYKFGFDFTGSNYVKDNDANEFLSSSDLVGGNIFGKVQTITANSLTLSRSSVPVSKTYIKGQAALDLIGLALTAANAGEITVTKVVARLGVDTNTTFNSSYGDTAANTVVDKVYLYKGSAPVAGPVGMTLVGTIGSGGYYKAEFQNLSEKIAAGATESYKIVVDLKNTMTATRYLMATFDDADITAMDSENNSVAAGANDTFNNVNTTTVANAVPTVYMTVNTSGTLAQKQEGSPDATILAGGASDKLFAKYKFTAISEGYTVKKLDVVIDTDTSPDFSDDYSADTSTSNNVSSVKLRYNDAAGATQSATGILSGGKASFSNLSFYVPKDGSAYIEVLGTLNTIDGGATSGASIRLGLNEYATTNTFEALGEASSETLDYTDIAGSFTITAAADVKSMVLRKTAPTVDKASGLSATLGDGQKDFYGFSVTADAGAAIALKRVAVNTSFTTGITVNQLQVLETKAGVTNDITSNLSIRNKLGQNLKLGGSNLATDGGSATSDVVYITWDKAATDEGVISAGQTATYTLRSNISSAASGDSISSYIAYDSVSGPATSTSAGVATLRATVAASPETATASPNNTRLVWRWASATTAYLDANGSGDYEAASDYLVTTVTLSVGDAAYTVDQIIPGVLRFTTDDLAAGDGTAAVYFDLDADGNYTVADLAIGVTMSTDGNPSDDAVMAFTTRYTSTGTTIYFDGTDGLTAANGTYTAGDDTVITDALLTQPTTAASNNDEVYTSNYNFVWSDNSNTSHTTSTVDWSNGYLVKNILSGVSHTMSK